jgi:diguanylate cyclase
VALDDFGTGYSSLAYLKQFPVDALKIDRSFVAGMTRDPQDRMIVSAVVSLAHSFGLLAVAEGVETAEQLAELRHLGCDFAQGYLWSKPLEPDAFTAWMTARKHAGTGVPQR